MLDIPVVIMFFIRPEKLREVFEKIKIVKPKQLFLIQDGPRVNNYKADMEKIIKCREMFNEIDWKCEIYRNFSDKNLGCGVRPATGLTWVFNKVDRAIILEDDCVPDLTFFAFCEQMLSKYENDNRVMLISGMNLLSEYDTEYSYVFSKACTIGAWATWKRTWKEYDFEISKFDDKCNKKILKNNIKFKNIIDSKFAAWDLTREKVKYKELISWWDYQLHFLLYLRNGLGIVPKVNLIQNIGYGEDATNIAKKDEAVHFNLDVGSLTEKIKHPKEIIVDDKFDQKLYNNQCKKVSRTRIILAKYKRKLLRFTRR